MTNSYNPKSHAPSVYIPCWLIQIPNNLLSFAAKMLYGRLAQWSNEQGKVYRSVPQLSKEIGAERRQIDRYLKELKDVGLIATYHPQAGGVNHFEFYDHEWMHIPINEHLSYNSNSNPTTKLSLPHDKIVVTPTTNMSSINIKEIKEIKITNKTHNSSSVKKDVLSLDQICNQNPHNLNIDLLEEWKRSRKKPITQRVMNSFNKELDNISKAGIPPLEAVNKMLDKQWSTVELRFFEQDIAFLNGVANKKQSTGSSLSRVISRHLNEQGTVYDEYGNREFQ